MLKKILKGGVDNFSVTRRNLKNLMKYVDSGIYGILFPPNGRK